MHKMAKEIMDRIKSKINSCGIDAITEQELIEMKYWTCVADCMTSYDYHCKIIEEMEKSENEYGEDYDENGPLRGYRGRSATTGRYVHRPYRTIGMSPYYRDMDLDEEKMYYTDDSAMENVNDRNGYSRGYSDGYAEGQNTKAYESRIDKAIRSYTDAMSSTTNSDKDKENKIKTLTELMHSFEMELLPHVKNMDANEKQIARNNLDSLKSKLS